MTLCKIWIPSWQKYIQMYEISCEQYRHLLKNIDDSSEFDFLLNQLLIQNMWDKNINVEDFTIIDKFIIFLQLRVISCGRTLNLTSTCGDCQTPTEFTVDLNNILDESVTILDRSFKKTFNFQKYILVCDIPAICLNEDRNSYKASGEDYLNAYMFSFFQNIQIYDSLIDLKTLTIPEKHTICSSLPFALMTLVKKNYIDEIHQIMTNTIVVQNICSKCQKKLSLNIDINNITDVIKVLFQNDSALNILGKYANISANCHLDYNFYKNINPLELEVLYNMSKGSSSATSTNNSEQDINLFDQFKLNDEEMVESPSEFK